MPDLVGAGGRVLFWLEPPQADSEQGGEDREQER